MADVRLYSIQATREWSTLISQTASMSTSSSYSVELQVANIGDEQTEINSQENSLSNSSITYNGSGGTLSLVEAAQNATDYALVQGNQTIGTDHVSSKNESITIGEFKGLQRTEIIDSVQLVSNTNSSIQSGVFNGETQGTTSAALYLQSASYLSIGEFRVDSTSSADLSSLSIGYSETTPDPGTGTTLSVVASWHSVWQESAEGLTDPQSSQPGFEFLVTYSSGSTQSDGEGGTTGTSDTGVLIRTVFIFGLHLGSTTFTESGAYLVSPGSQSAELDYGTTRETTTTIQSTTLVSSQSRLTTTATSTQISTTTSSTISEVGTTNLSILKTLTGDNISTYNSRGTPFEIYNLSYVVPDDLVIWLLTGPADLQLVRVQDVAISQIGAFAAPTQYTEYNSAGFTFLTDSNTPEQTWNNVHLGGTFSSFEGSVTSPGTKLSTHAFVGSLSDDTTTAAADITNFTDTISEFIGWVTGTAPIGFGEGFSTAQLTTDYGNSTTQAYVAKIGSDGQYVGFELQPANKRVSSIYDSISNLFVNELLTYYSIENSHLAFESGLSVSATGYSSYGSGTAQFSGQSSSNFTQSSEVASGFSSGAGSQSTGESFTTSKRSSSSSSESGSATSTIPVTDSTTPSSSSSTSYVQNQGNTNNDWESAASSSSEIAATYSILNNRLGPDFQTVGGGVDLLIPRQASGLAGPFSDITNRSGVFLLLASTAQFPWLYVIGQQPDIQVPFPWLRYFTTVDNLSRTTLATNTDGFTYTTFTSNTQSNSYTVRWGSKSADGSVIGDTLTIYIASFTGGTKTTYTQFLAEFETALPVSDDPFYTLAHTHNSGTVAGGWMPNSMVQLGAKHSFVAETIRVNTDTTNVAGIAILNEATFDAGSSDLTFYSLLPGMVVALGYGNSTATAFNRYGP